MKYRISYPENDLMEEKPVPQAIVEPNDEDLYYISCPIYSIELESLDDLFDLLDDKDVKHITIKRDNRLWAKADNPIQDNPIIYIERSI